MRLTVLGSGSAPKLPLTGWMARNRDYTQNRRMGFGVVSKISLFSQLSLPEHNPVLHHAQPADVADALAERDVLKIRYNAYRDLAARSLDYSSPDDTLRNKIYQHRERRCDSAQSG